MPRAIISLALALTAASLSGCASHHAIARAVNLTAADVPGFSVAPPPQAKSPADKNAEGELFRCAGARGPHRESADLAHASSPSFQLKRGIIDLSVSSEVGVARSPAAARAELGAIHSSRVRACFTRFLRSVLASGRLHSASLGDVTIRSGNPPAPGASGSFGWRVRATFAIAGASLPVYLDMLGFVFGPARVTLVSSGALEPFPASVQQRLYELLLARAQANA